MCAYVSCADPRELFPFSATFNSIHAVLRDIEERGRDLEGILRQYVQFVKPSFEDFILPVSRFVPLCPTISLSQMHAERSVCTCFVGSHAGLLKCSSHVLIPLADQEVRRRHYPAWRRQPRYVQEREQMAHHGTLL